MGERGGMERGRGEGWSGREGRDGGGKELQRMMGLLISSCYKNAPEPKCTCGTRRFEANFNYILLEGSGSAHMKSFTIGLRSHYSKTNRFRNENNVVFVKKTLPT